MINEVKDNENVRHVARMDRNAHNIFVGKPEEKTQLGRHRNKREDKNKIDFEVSQCENVEQIHFICVSFCDGLL